MEKTIEINLLMKVGDLFKRIREAHQIAQDLVLEIKVTGSSIKLTIDQAEETLNDVGILKRNTFVVLAKAHGGNTF